jgi:cytochrome c-550 PedF
VIRQKQEGKMARKGLVGWAAALLLAVGLVTPQIANSHGDVTPQPVDTAGLEPLGEEWRSENPYRGNAAANATAVKIGMSAYNQNCARCHGIDAISGGIAPDLRGLENNAEGDQWFLSRIRKGARKPDGSTMMPPFEGLMNQEAMWAIRTYIESRPME